MKLKRDDNGLAVRYFKLLLSIKAILPDAVKGIDQSLVVAVPVADQMFGNAGVRQDTSYLSNSPNW